jgi:hypothetical protein
MFPNDAAYRGALAARLLFLREHVGLSQRGLASTIDSGQNIIFRAEKSLRLSTDALTQLAFFYISQHDINPGWLFAADNEPVPMHLSTSSRNHVAARLMDDFLQQVAKDLPSENTKN